MRVALAFALLSFPALALAAGTDDDFDPPTPSPTTEVCEEGTVWDKATEACVPAEQTTNDEAAMMRDVRELAYAGRYADAGAVLDRLTAGDAWVLTYRGFIARKTGDMEAANRFYRAAIETDPDHLLARSYMGQGFVEAGRRDAARVQLAEIRARGGAGGWPEAALVRALQQGAGFSY